MYSSNLIRIPTPRFAVFYNGTDPQPERQTLKLSDAYEKNQRNVELELTVTMYNINYGCNEDIMDACRTLKEYAMYAERVRMYAKQMPLAKAVEKAVNECIIEGILTEFLRKNRAEAIKMSIYEYDEALHIKNEQEYWYKTGVENGKKQEREQGEIRLAHVNQLTSILIDMGRVDDLKRATADKAYQEQLMSELLPGLET